MTKNNPGKYDCYANTEPDEPMFVLLGRDKHAPTLVWLWSVLRELAGEKPEKVAEARECCVAMIRWAHEHGRESVGIGEAVLAGILELIRAANANKGGRLNMKTDVEAIRAILTVASLGDERDPKP